jgi:GR25 family glycosyltransferase involved in LPS biosynthesis
MIAEKWAANSPHRVHVEISLVNLGLHKHFIKAFTNFFSRHEFGIVLEDDIEFRQSFIDYIDQMNLSRGYRNYWSIQGHNPLTQAAVSFETNHTVQFEETNFHSVWGWASHSESIERMLTFISDANDSNVLIKSVVRGSELFTSDPLLKLAIKNVWLQKLLRARTLNSGGWDNWWVAAAWLHQTSSIMPNISISRESLIQTEGQSHSHAQKGSRWAETRLEVLSTNSQITKNSNHKEIELLRAWGITRPYSWLYSPRIAKQYAKSIELLEKVN